MAIARAFTHEVCLRLIDELGVGEATVSDLAARTGQSQPSVSSHLALLRKAGLVEAEIHGRQRAYRLLGPAPALALSTLRTLAGEPGTRHRRRTAGSPKTNPDAPLRRARTCYDHLAGVAGVALLDRLLERHWLEPEGERDYRLTEAGEAGLARAGVDVAGARRSRRAFALGCPDWTEQRPHLGGALGASLLAALLASRRARLEPRSRVVNLKGTPWPA